MATTFAERLRWSRYNGPIARRKNRVLGATLLAREVGCAQSLISGLERNNAKGSEYSNRFAAALGVEAGWLATGMGRAPEGFDEKVAKQMLHGTTGRELLEVAHGAPAAHGRAGVEPQWTVSPPAAVAEDTAPPTSSATALQRSLMEGFIQFVDLVGVHRAQAVLDLMHGYIETLRQGAARQDQV